MLEQNIGKPEQSDGIQEPSNNLIEEAWGKPAQSQETNELRCPIPRPELSDRTTREFQFELAEALRSGIFGAEFVEASRKLAEKCKDNPNYVAELKRVLGADIAVGPDGINFSSNLFPSKKIGVSTYTLEVPFNGDPVKGYMHHTMAPPGTREVSPKLAANQIFHSNWNLHPNPWPILR